MLVNEKLGQLAYHNANDDNMANFTGNNDFFILSNLTSFLSLFTLKNRNNPKRNVQIKIANKKNISLVSISKLKLLLLIIKQNNIEIIKEKDPIKS